MSLEATEAIRQDEAARQARARPGRLPAEHTPQIAGVFEVSASAISHTGCTEVHRGAPCTLQVLRAPQYLSWGPRTRRDFTADPVIKRVTCMRIHIFPVLTTVLLNDTN